MREKISILNSPLYKTGQYSYYQWRSGVSIVDVDWESRGYRNFFYAERTINLRIGTPVLEQAAVMRAFVNSGNKNLNVKLPLLSPLSSPFRLLSSAFCSPVPEYQPKRAGAQRQKPKILKNSYSFIYKHLRFSKTAKYPNFRTKRAGRPKYEGRPFFAPKKGVSRLC